MDIFTDFSCQPLWASSIFFQVLGAAGLERKQVEAYASDRELSADIWQISAAKNRENVWQLSDRNLAPFSTFPFAFRLLRLLMWFWRRLFWSDTLKEKHKIRVESVPSTGSLRPGSCVWALISHCSSCVTDVCRFLTDLNVNNDIFLRHHDVQMHSAVICSETEPEGNKHQFRFYVFIRC